MPNITPGVSSTQLPGYSYNGSLGSSNSAWKDAALDILAAQWATTPIDQRGSFMQPYWAVGAVNGQSQYGSLDMADGVDSMGRIYTHPATVAGLSRYLSSYTPGSNPALEGVIPYIAPQANEFIESPEAVAIRVAQANADRNFGLQMAQEDRLRWQAQLSADMQRQAISAQAAGNAAARASADAAAKRQAAATKYAADQAAAASRYNTQAGFLSNVYGTDAGMYNAGQANQIGAWTGAGNVGLGLQSIYDSRTNNIIQNMSNPADFVQRTNSIRALAAPESEDVVAYRDVTAINDAISKLLNYSSSATKPITPTLPGSTPAPAPTQSGSPSGANGGRAANAGRRGSWEQMDEFASGSPGWTNEGMYVVGDKGVPNQRDTRELVITTGPSKVIPMNKDGIKLSQLKHYYAGTGLEQPTDGLPRGDYKVGINDTAADSSTSTAPAQTPAQLTPNAVNTGAPVAPKGYTSYNWDDFMKSGLAPSAMAQQTWGTQQLYQNEAGRVVRVDPTTGAQYEMYQGVQPVAPTSTPGPNSMLGAFNNAIVRNAGLPAGQRQLANQTTVSGFRNTTAPQPDRSMTTPTNTVTELAGRRPTTGPATVPTTPTTTTPPAATTPATTTPPPATATPAQQTSSTNDNGLANALNGLSQAMQNLINPPGTTGGAPNTTLPNYTNEQIQQMPFLRYLQGLMSGRDFNTINSGSTPGPFGINIPRAGGLNLRKLYEISQNPDDLDVLRSIYKGGNANLDAEASLAAQRAPRGGAYRTSAVMT